MSWITILFSPLAAGLMYALNWGALGYRDRKIRGLWMLGVAGLIYAWLGFQEALAQYAMDLPPRRVLLPLSLVLAWQFYLGQQAPFERYMRQGGKKAPVYLPLAWGVAIWLVIMGSAVGWLMVQSARDYAEIEQAIALVQQGKYEEAEPLLKELAVKQPDETSIYWNLAVIYLETSRPELAKQEVQKVLAHDPDNKEAKQFLKDLEGPFKE